MNHLELTDKLQAMRPLQQAYRRTVVNHLRQEFCVSLDILRVLATNDPERLTIAHNMLNYLVPDEPDSAPPGFFGKYVLSIHSRMAGFQTTLRRKVGNSPLCFPAPMNQPSKKVLNLFGDNITPTKYLAAVNMMRFHGITPISNMYYYGKDSPPITKSLMERYGSGPVEHAVHLAMERGEFHPIDLELAMESYLSMPDDGVSLIDVARSLA